MTLPAYFINIDRPPDRWQAITANLEQFGVQAEPVPAVDVSLLAEQKHREIEHSKAMMHLLEPGHQPVDPGGGFRNASQRGHSTELLGFMACRNEDCEVGKGSATTLDCFASVPDDTMWARRPPIQTMLWWPCRLSDKLGRCAPCLDRFL